MGSPVNFVHTNSDDDEHSRSKWRRDTPSPSQSSNASTNNTSLQKSNILLDANSTKRKSAFLPYRPHGTTVLTNLQRGNTAATFCPVEVSLSFHERCGQGEITAEQVATEAANHEDEGGIDFRDSNGFTSLHWAASYGQQASAQMLLDAGANPNNQAPDLITPLLLAAAGGHNELVRLLLERGAKSAHMDIMGNTALMYAAAGNHPHTCNEILSRDLDMSATNENGDTAYSIAVESGSALAQAVMEQYLCAMISLGSA